MKPEYEKRIIELKIEDRVAFLDYLPDEKIPYYYSEADIFVLPSIVDENGDTEGLGVVLVEANACECPVIGSKVGGIVDVIEDGYNGFLSEEKNSGMLAELILKLAADEHLRKEMGRKGRMKVESNFSWQGIAEKMENVSTS